MEQTLLAGQRRAVRTDRRLGTQPNGPLPSREGDLVAELGVVQRWLAFLSLGCSCLLIDWWGYARLAFPFTVIGMNAIIAYLLGQVHSNGVFNALKRVVGTTPFSFLGEIPMRSLFITWCRLQAIGSFST
jgi:hypothetical protein